MKDRTGLSAEDKELLERYAKWAKGPLGAGWCFGTSGGVWPHDAAAALAVIRACLALDVPVTDKLTPGTWLKLVSKVAGLAARVEALEKARP